MKSSSDVIGASLVELMVALLLLMLIPIIGSQIMPMANYSVKLFDELPSEFD